MPKGTVEQGEEFKETALREVLEESGAKATIIKYIGKSEYSFTVPEDTVEKEVHWYLMMADSYYSKPQREEYFVDSGFYKYHEAYHLLRFSNEKQILEKAYGEYLELKRTICGAAGNTSESGIPGFSGYTRCTGRRQEAEIPNMAVKLTYHRDLYLGESINAQKLDKIKRKLENKPLLSGVS